MADTKGCVIQANPDVTGIGIRASIYALSLGGRLSSILVQFVANQEYYKDFERAVNSSLSVQGLALLCTAIYQTFQNQLTLFHAVCVIHLLSLLGLNVISRGHYGPTGRRRAWSAFILTAVSFGAFAIFNTLVWVTAPRFGSQRECNAFVVYVVFGVNIQVTALIFRWIMAAITLFIIVFVLLILLVLTCACALKKAERYLCFWKNSTRSEEDSTRGHLVYGLVTHVSFNVYAIVSLEQTIARNQLESSEKQWTFGQIVALFLLLGVANELLSLLLTVLDKRDNCSLSLSRSEVRRTIVHQA